MKRLLILLCLLFPTQVQAQNVEIMTKLPLNAYVAYFGLNNDDILQVNKFGHNDDVDIANPADLWSGGSQTVSTDRIYVYGGFLSSYDSVQVASTSDEDSTGNGGATTVEIQGLDSLWNMQTVSINLEGTDTVNTSEVWRRIFRVVVTAGGGSVPDTSSNNGIIIVNTWTGDTRMAQIEVNKSQTEMAIYTIPAGFTGYILNYYGSLEKATGAAAHTDLELWARPFGQVFQLKHEQGLASDGSSHFGHLFSAPLVIGEKSDIRMRINTAKDAVDVTGGFDLLLVKK